MNLNGFKDQLKWCKKSSKQKINFKMTVESLQLIATLTKKCYVLLCFANVWHAFGSWCKNCSQTSSRQAACVCVCKSFVRFHCPADTICLVILSCCSKGLQQSKRSFQSDAVFVSHHLYGILVVYYFPLNTVESHFYYDHAKAIHEHCKCVASLKNKFSYLTYSTYSRELEQEWKIVIE